MIKDLFSGWPAPTKVSYIGFTYFTSAVMQYHAHRKNMCLIPRLFLNQIRRSNVYLS